jgi:hypothetical protein
MTTIFFHIGFEIIFYEYNQLYNHLGHLVIDFLIAKDLIPYNVSTIFMGIYATSPPLDTLPSMKFGHNISSKFVLIALQCFKINPYNLDVIFHPYLKLGG